MLRRAAGLAAGVGLVAVAAAQDPGQVKPVSYIPVMPSVAKVEASSAPADGAAALPRAVADARAAHAKLRDYTCHLIRQERVHGKLLPEQTAELRVRTQPHAVNVRVVAPKALAGQEASYLSSRTTARVRFKAAREDGIRNGFLTLPVDDPKVLADTRHTLPDTGLLAVLDRAEKVLATEKRLNHPVQVLTAEYTFGGRPVTRYEVFAERPHPNRYAYRVVLYIDKETKLPARWEAHDRPKSGGSDEGELIEVHSFVGLKPNTGLGESAFER